MPRKFHGAEYDPKRDATRLQTQQDRIREFLLAMTRRGSWQTVPEVAGALGIRNHASVERQIRYLRQEKFGSYIVAKRQRKSGGPMSGMSEFQVNQPREVLQLELQEA